LLNEDPVPGGFGYLRYPVTILDPLTNTGLPLGKFLVVVINLVKSFIELDEAGEDVVAIILNSTSLGPVDVLVTI
jgi:hypothetical protein